MSSMNMLKKNKKKVLTISVAAYNVGDYIGRCLKSLIIDRRHMEKLEVLIENDGSTDNTAEVVEKYATEYPDTFKLINKKNGGYGSTVNNSIKLATGKYFKILDGDDEFNTEILTDFIDTLEEIDTDVVVSSCVRTFESDTRADIEECPFQKSISGEKKIDILISPECKKNFYKMHTSTYKTEIYRKNHIVLPERILYTDVVAAYVPLLYSKSVYIFNKPIYIYHIGREGQSVSIEKRIAHAEDRITASKEVLRYAEGRGSSPVYDMYAGGISCAAVIADHLLLCNISAKNRRRIIDYDNYVKKINMNVWKKMCFYRTIKLLRQARFSWAMYIALHFERKTKVGKIS